MNIDLKITRNLCLCNTGIKWTSLEIGWPNIEIWQTIHRASATANRVDLINYLNLYKWVTLIHFLQQPWECADFKSIYYLLANQSDAKNTAGKSRWPWKCKKSILRYDVKHVAHIWGLRRWPSNDAKIIWYNTPKHEDDAQMFTFNKTWKRIAKFFVTLLVEHMRIMNDNE